MDKLTSNEPQGQAELAPRPSAKAPTAEMWAKSHFRGLISRLEDEYHAYESAEGGSQDEAIAQEAWRAAQNEIREIVTGLYASLRGMVELNAALARACGDRVDISQDPRPAAAWVALAKAEGRT
jgi:hypothetical protein